MKSIELGVCLAIIYLLLAMSVGVRSYFFKQGRPIKILLYLVSLALCFAAYRELWLVGQNYGADEAMRTICLIAALPGIASFLFLLFSTLNWAHDAFQRPEAEE